MGRRSSPLVGKSWLRRVSVRGKVGVQLCLAELDKQAKFAVPDLPGDDSAPDLPIGDAEVRSRFRVAHAPRRWRNRLWWPCRWSLHVAIHPSQSARDVSVDSRAGSIGG